MIAVAEIARDLNLVRAGTGWKGNCPVCGYVNAFSLDVGEGGTALGWCASCQNRAAIGAILRDPDAKRCSREQHDQRAAASTWTAQQRAERGFALFDEARHGAEPVRLYLAGRGLVALARCPDIRFHPDCPHPAKRKYPALITLLRDRCGGPRAIHRTFITMDGRKSDALPVRASLGPVQGAAFWTCDPPENEMVVAEGIETAASAGEIFNLPALAAISAGNLELSLRLPACITSVLIAADPDPAGRRAAEHAACRWREEGRRVRIEFPTIDGDFNDQLLKGVA